MPKKQKPGAAKSPRAPIERPGGRVGQAVTLTLTAMAHGGAALGRHEGQVVFVPYAIPGEIVQAEIVKDQARFAEARLIEVLQPSPERVTPACPHFGPCGGCQYQHIDYPAQLRYKRQVVVDQLRRIGGIDQPPVRDTLPTSPYGYRNQTRLGISPEGTLGYRAARSQRIIPITTCPILDPRLVELYQDLDLDTTDLVEVTLQMGIHTGEQMIVLQTRADEAPEMEVDFPVSIALQLENGAIATLIGEPTLTEEIDGRLFRISAGSFFQVNSVGAGLLVQHVTGYLDLHGSEIVLDAYCGVGLFAAFLAEKAGRLIGVESNEYAVADAAVNLERFDQVELYQDTVENVLPGLDVCFDAGVLDPPRAGCEPAVLEALLARPIPRLAYVSCDPATLARDLKRLLEGGYRLVEVQPVDMFPQSFHIESIAFLRFSAPPA